MLINCFPHHLLIIYLSLSSGPASHFGFQITKSRRNSTLNELREFFQPRLKTPSDARVVALFSVFIDR